MVYPVYILASATGVLYIGMTNHMERRTRQHQEGQLPGFTKDYNVHRLIYFEAFGDVRDAINREKQLKGWRREKKLALVRQINATLRDLYGVQISLVRLARLSGMWITSGWPVIRPQPRIGPCLISGKRKAATDYRHVLADPDKSQISI